MTTPTSKPSIVALIPARAGSKRVPGKNVKPLGGKPLIQWTIEAALESGIFADVCVVTDITDLPYQLRRDARVRFFQRSPDTAKDTAPDILWVREFFEHNSGGDAFAILRPTSPFRMAETIRRAWSQFLDQQPCDSLRAVQPVKEHPMKMWEVRDGGSIAPIFPAMIKRPGVWENVPAHSMPTQSLPEYYVQNASLEIACTRVVRNSGTISGSRVMPFFTEGLEGFDINTPEDWIDAEYHMAERLHPIEYLG